MTIDLGQAKEWIEPVLTLLGFLAAFCTAAWAMLRKGQKFLDTQGQLVTVVKQLRIEAAAGSKKSDDTLQEVGRLKFALEQREREIARLEGRIQTVHSDYKETAGDLREVIGNLKALWTTLRTIHPDKVPKRASDGG